MELVEGQTLAEELKAKKPLTTKDIVEIGIQLTRALDYAHKKGIIHRDVKPGNIMLAHRHQHDQGRRLRHLPHRRQRHQRRDAADADRQRPRHAALHVARAGGGREGRLALRPLLRRRRDLPAADRPPAVRGRHADQRRVQDHEDGPAVARQGAPGTAAVAAPHRRARAQEAAGQALPERRGVRAGADRRRARTRRRGAEAGPQGHPARGALGGDDGRAWSRSR